MLFLLLELHYLLLVCFFADLLVVNWMESKIKTPSMLELLSFKIMVLRDLT
jgi:hypothetical protein